MAFRSSATTLRTLSFNLTGALFLAFACVTGCAQSDGDARAAYDAAMAVAEPTERISALQRFIQSYPQAEQATAAREEVVRGFAALGEVKLGAQDAERALAYFKQAIAAFPPQMDDKFFDETASRIPLAVSVRGYRAEAVTLAREMDARFAKDAHKLGVLGEFYLTVEDAGDALRVLKTAAKLAPEDARLRRALGAAYRVNLKLSEAADEYRAAIKLEPDDKRATYELANLERGRGAYEEAVRLYKRQLEIDPQHAGAVKGLALVYVAQGKRELAGEALKKAAQMSGGPDFYFQTQLAFAYLTRNQVADARQAADAAIAAEPRFSWARMAAAEVDLAEGKYFDAERNLLAAQNYANFPTLAFTLGKVYLTVEDFDGAVEQFNKAFRYSGGKFKATLGGVLELETDSLAPLLARERQAAIFKFEPTTSEVEFQIIEALTRVDAGLRGNRPSSGLVSGLVLSQSASKRQNAELERAVNDFVQAEGSRRQFRALYAAQRLIKSGQLLEHALRLADGALDAAETATAPEGSLRDYPNYDREGRLRLFRGRAGEVKGWALQRLGRVAEAIATLQAAAEEYGPLPERKRALWRLAAATEAAGREQEALDLYLAAYEPPDKSARTADLNRSVIEALYRKLNGSLQGLDERIGRAQAQPASLIAFGPRERTAATSARNNKQAAVPSVVTDTQAEAAKATPGASAEKLPAAEKSELNAGAESKGEAEETPAEKLEAKAELKADAKHDEVKTDEKSGARADLGPAAEATTPAAEKGTPAEVEPTNVIELPVSLPTLKAELPDTSGLLTLAVNAAPLVEEEIVAPEPTTPEPASPAPATVSAGRTDEAASSFSTGELPVTSPIPGWRERPASLAAPFLFRDTPPLIASFAAPDLSEVGEAPDPDAEAVEKAAAKATAKEVPKAGADAAKRAASNTAASAEESPRGGARSGSRSTPRRPNLPVEIESRAAAVGLSSGSLSRTMAQEIEGEAKAPPDEATKIQPEANAAPVASPTEIPAETPSATRPRRVESADNPIPATRKRRVTTPDAAPRKRP